MKRLAVVITVSGLLATVSLLGLTRMRDSVRREACQHAPCYRGRTQAEWERQLVHPSRVPAERERERETAAEALGHFGGASVPALIAALHHRDPWVRVLAARTVGQIGAPAGPAVSALMEMFREDGDDFGGRPNWRFHLPDIAGGALESLGSVGVDVVPPLVEALKDTNLHVALRAAMWLEAIWQDRTGSAAGATHPDVLDTYARVLTDPTNDLELRERAIRLLAGSGPTALPILTQGLNDPSVDIRIRVVEVLGPLGSAALPALTQAIRDPDPNVRRAAGYRLETLATSDQNPTVRQLATDALRHIGGG